MNWTYLPKHQVAQSCRNFVRLFLTAFDTQSKNVEVIKKEMKNKQSHEPMISVISRNKLQPKIIWRLGWLQTFTPSIAEILDVWEIISKCGTTAAVTIQSSLFIDIAGNSLVNFIRTKRHQWFSVNESKGSKTVTDTKKAFNLFFILGKKVTEQAHLVVFFDLHGFIKSSRRSLFLNNVLFNTALIPGHWSSD